MSSDAAKGSSTPPDDGKGDGTERHPGDSAEGFGARPEVRRPELTSGLPPEQVLAGLSRVFENVWKENEFNRNLTQYLLQLTGSSMVALYSLNSESGVADEETGDAELLALALVAGRAVEGLAKHGRIAMLVQSALVSGVASRATLPFPDGNQFVFAAPFNSAGGKRICLLAALPPERQLYSEPSFAIVQLATQFFVQRELFLDGARDRTSFRQATTLVDSFSNSSVNGRTLRHSCHLLAGDLQKFVGCDHVAIATGGSRCKVQALSSMADWDRRSTGVTQLRRAMQEAVARDEILVWPKQDGLGPDADGIHGYPAPQDALLREYEASLVVIGPLRCAAPATDDQHSGQESGQASGAVAGAWVFLWSRPEAKIGERELRIIDTAAPLIASQVSVLEKAKPGRVGAMLRNSSPGRRMVMVLASIAIPLLLLLPIPYSVASDCRVQANVRRTVASPIDNRLHKTYVRPGERVEKGQILAELDGRELRWKLAEAKARLGAAMKKRDNAMVEGRASTTQMAQLEAEGVRLEVSMLDYRVNHLEIIAPISGVVLSGSLEQSEGVPVSTGQMLFEIAPLDRMRVEIAIPDGEVRHVTRGATTKIRLESLASKTWRSSIDSLFPISEIQNGKNVFIATAELVDEQRQLLPGMKGSARTAAGKKPIGWILFHRLWDFLRLRTW